MKYAINLMLKIYFGTEKLCAFASRIWYFSTAIGLAMNKKIFIFPWLSQMRFRTDADFLRLCHILNEEDAIVLVPCSDKIKIPQENKFNVVRMSSLFEVDFENMDR